ncbi:MAG: type II secretion system protein GspN, partial [Desulfobulbaceae bacterium]|nr:type II secretion system protein GspN [Desulfobulbaceae bacterium]
MAMGWLTPDRKKWLGFAAWILFVTVVALIARFPADVAADYLERALAERLPGYRFAIDEAAVTPLLRLRMTGCRVATVEAEAEPILQFAEVVAAPSWWGLLRGRKGVCFSGKGYGGEMEGKILLRPGSMDIEEFALYLRKMQLQRYPRLKNLLGRKMAGEISGDVVMSAKTGRLADGEGSVEFSLRHG